MKIYNTLTRSLEEFRPLKEKELGLYTCGPTVYHYAHIGNLKTYIFEDFLRRSFEFAGFRVKHVMNVTDVGHLVSDSDEGADKMEIGAKREGKTAWDVARFYTEAFFSDFDELNCERPEIICRATDHIAEMIGVVKKLEEKGYTYKISDGIYFDTSKFEKYGELAGKAHMEGLKAGARIEYNTEKRNPTDFALWKFSPAGEKRQMEWESPWGTGFPGWHIECSAMSVKYLGETFDMHCGGVDHIPIHHTNEIAQAEAATGKKFVNYWVHGEFLLIGKDAKMSKSKDNFLTLQLIKDKGFSPLEYRYFCSQAHYRKQLEFSFEALEASRNALRTLKNSLAELKTKAGESVADKNSAHYREFVEALSEDINIPKAVAVLWETVRDNKLKPEEKLGLAAEFDKVLAFDLFKEEKVEVPAEIAALVEDRQNAKKSKDYKKADEIRGLIKEKGYLLEDTPKGPKIKKIVISNQ